MYDWYATSQHGKMTVEERVAGAEKERRLPSDQTRKSLLGRLSAFVRTRRDAEQEHLPLSGKPATSRSR